MSIFLNKMDRSQVALKSLNINSKFQNASLRDKVTLNNPQEKPILFF